MFAYILLALFLIFILPRLIRGILLVRRVRRHVRQAYEAMYGTSREPRQEPRRRDGWSAPAPRRRKIDPSVAQQVKYEEISQQRTIITPQATYTTEQQIVDAEWEEIPGQSR